EPALRKPLLPGFSGRHQRLVLVSPVWPATTPRRPGYGPSSRPLARCRRPGMQLLDADTQIAQSFQRLVCEHDVIGTAFNRRDFNGALAAFSRPSANAAWVAQLLIDR